MPGESELALILVKFVGLWLNCLNEIKTLSCKAFPSSFCLENSLGFLVSGSSLALIIFRR